MLKNFSFFRLIFRSLFLAFDDAGGAGGGGEPTAEDKAKAEEAKKQEELNRQFADRAARAAEAERKKIMESLGVKDPEEAQALLKIAREADEKTKTETEKLAAKAKAADEAREKAEAEAKAKLEEANRKLLDSEIKINARTAITDKAGKTTRPAFRKEAMEEVLYLINRKEIEEKDGEIKGVDKALEALAKAKPHLLEEPQEQRRGTPLGRDGKKKAGDGEERTPIIGSL